ncbi:MAG: GNAT family N-acetyltransferase [Oscillatoriophycideae cyanobacterium NC_groundwater_1537_Pr4_S-0.65um_50_18]|nr:GNAT family N-acetyltransferase [Oscillatoriophycideae cyanobacterium NC_groundwater_1537_Pr4_S-0.65um_50_18]
MKDSIRIEPAHPDDAAVMLAVHADAVHQTAAPFYPAEVIQSWAPLPITSDRIQRVEQKWILNPEHRTVVSKHNGQVVGFGFIDKNSELQGLYVHPSWGRRGIAAKILAVLEQEAISLGLLGLQVDASINAEAFYSKQGFETIAHATYRLGSGQEMACVKMRKTLDVDHPILENPI